MAAGHSCGGHAAAGYTFAVSPTRTSRGRGWFITIEGPEGSGKTTQAERLLADVRRAGLPVALVREPGGTAVGERIRDLLLDADPASVPIGPRTDALLFNAAALRATPGDGTLVVQNGVAPKGQAVVQLVITGSAIGHVKWLGKILIASR